MLVEEQSNMSLTDLSYTSPSSLDTHDAVASAVPLDAVTAVTTRYVQCRIHAILGAYCLGHFLYRLLLSPKILTVADFFFFIPGRRLPWMLRKGWHLLLEFAVLLQAFGPL